jgi:hypothetical protein
MATAFMMKPNGAVPVSRMIDVIDGAVDPGSVVTYAISIYFAFGLMLADFPRYACS